jgi:hypothetical protein
MKKPLLLNFWAIHFEMMKVKLSGLIVIVPQRQTEKTAKNVSSKLYTNEHHTNYLPRFL